MESVDLEMEDIFEMDGDGEDDTEFQSLAPLPDLPEAEDTANGEGNQNAEEAENMEVLARLKDLSKGASKRVAKRPQPKLDPTRLTGERGIAILPKVFEKVKFKGKGHEAEDLAVIMRHLEHWGHRLFPKMPFDEVLQRIEKLGSRREVQTCIRKIRMDMPVLNVDFVNEEDEEDNVKRGNKGDAPAPVVDVDTDEVWEQIMKEEEERRSRESQSATQPPSTYQTPRTPAQQLADSNHLTPEQLERIEQNKRLALERKAKKIGTPLPPTASPAQSCPEGSQTVTSDQIQPSPRLFNVSASQKQLTLTHSKTGNQKDKDRDEQNSSKKISNKNGDENFPEKVTDRDMESELNYGLEGATNYAYEQKDEETASECKSDTRISSSDIINNKDTFDNAENSMQDMELDQDQLMEELDN